VPVLIDGNNLLHAANDAGTSDLRIGRSMLCDTVGEWARRRAERVHVVFDGPAPNEALAKQIGHRAIKISYSGAGVTADAVLARVIQQDSAARHTIVVSSDKEVVRAARRRRAKTVPSRAFWVAITRDLDRPERPPVAEPREKEVGLSPEATDQWLQEFGLE
jgi:predicted RNA-binding protein with PIN domain